MKKHSIARAAVSAGLAIAMAFGTVAPATMAFADTAANSTITINNVPGNVTSFKGYEIFKADVVDASTGTSGKTVSNIAWANDDVKAAVEGVITANGGTNADIATAQDAAEWIQSKVTGTDNTTRVPSSSVADKIAKAVEGLTNQTTVAGGTTSRVLESGYWLFVTDPTTVDNKVNDVEGKKDTETYTSPIFAVVGGSSVDVTEKSSVPTVDKFVKNDKTNSTWGKVADSQAGQNLEYKLVGTVADNVATYDTYKYQFTDTLSAGLTADSTSIVVKIQNGTTETEVMPTTKTVTVNTDSATDAKNQTSTLTVAFDDLKAAAKTANVELNANSKINVYYNAKLDPNKAFKVASEDNPNEVKLTYSNNPHSTGTGDTVTHKVTDYTYKLAITKVDSGSATKKLQGAEFTIKATTPDDDGADSVSKDKYVQSDGTLGTEAHHFSTDENGEISVKGLDAGTYTVSEVKSPDGYNKVADFTFTITPTWNGDATALQTLTVEKKASYVDASVTNNNGQVNLTVKDAPGSGLPLTGQAGVTVTFVAGALVLAFGVSRVVRNRREQDAE